MAKTGIVFGLIMCGLTVACLFVSMEKSLTQFVPMIFGVAFFVLGIISLNPHLRYRTSFFVAVLAAIATVLGSIRFFILLFGQSNGKDINELSMQAIAAMSVISFAFLGWTLFWIRKREKRRRKSNRNESLDATELIGSSEMLSSTPPPPKGSTVGEPNPYLPPRSLPTEFPENGKADRHSVVPLSAPSQKHS